MGPERRETFLQMNYARVRTERKFGRRDARRSVGYEKSYFRRSETQKQAGNKPLCAAQLAAQVSNCFD